MNVVGYHNLIRSIVFQAVEAYLIAPITTGRFFNSKVYRDICEEIDLDFAELFIKLQYYKKMRKKLKKKRHYTSF